MNIGKGASYLWDVLTTPQSMGAVLVIVFIQYRSLLLSFVRMAMNDGVMHTLFNLSFNIADTMRGYYHMTNEIIRSLGQNRIFPFVGENHDSNYRSYSSPQSDLQTNDTTNNGTNCYKRNSSNEPLPQLVELRKSVVHNEEDVAAPQPADSGNVMSINSKSKILENEMKPLEPAFLKKEDYPPGWLVFHPILGISSVHEADQYEEEQLLQRENANGRSVDIEGTLPSKENK